MLPPAQVLARLVQLCDESGLTQVDIAERAGITPASLSRLLSCQETRRGPTISTVYRILLAIGCDWGDLNPEED